MRRVPFCLASIACLTLLGCSSNSPSEAKSSAPAAAKEVVPDIFHVKLDTSKGAIDIEVHRDWAPHGADHVYELVKTGFFDNARFFRVVRNFVAQFGINGDPKINQLWATAMLPDDPVKEHNVKGSVTFAALGPNTRTTQLFINLADNRRSLDSHGFAPIGKVVEGMDVAERLYNSYGETPPRGQGPDPDQIQRIGNDYLESHFPRLDFVKKASIQ
jgi:peptidyl-prolyl cis-trans isomerase A (cyclophilin A)